MKSEKFEKMRKYLQRDFELMLVLYIIFTVLNVIFFTEVVVVNFMYIIVRLAIIVLYVFGIKNAKKGEKSAGIFGLVIGILMFLNNSLIIGILGLIMAIHSIIYLVNYNK